MKCFSISAPRGVTRRPRQLAVSATLIALGVVLAPGANAQSVPTDLMDMNLADLMEMDVEARDSHGDEALPWLDPGRLRLSYRYLRHSFKGFRDGTKNISSDSLLGPPNGTTYAILQDRIVQEAHTFGLAYDITDRVSARLMIPYIRQMSDHHADTSLPPIADEFDDFTIRSDGIGDISLTGSLRVLDVDRQHLILSAGLSFPSGSTTEKGDTPLPGTKNQLPYTMQLGSGTWDIILSMGYHGSATPFESPGLATLGSIGWGAQIYGKIRTDENDRGYRLGHRMMISAWVSAQPLPWIEPFLRLNSEIWGRIRGNDDDFPTAPFPTPVADPANFGGERLGLSGGLNLRMPKLHDGPIYEALKKQEVSIEYGQPVYQSLNGPQPRERWRLSVDWSTSF